MQVGRCREVQIGNTHAPGARLTLLPDDLLPPVVVEPLLYRYTEGGLRKSSPAVSTESSCLHAKG